ncbi:MAG: 50S ribosomal protein L7/L12, partial [Flavisolibacter sp.]
TSRTTQRRSHRVIKRRRKHMSLDTIIAEIEKLNVLELVELTKTLQEKWGVSAAPVAAAAGPAAVAEAAPAAAVVEEQTEFDAILSEVGPNKINVIKVVREITGLGLKEAKAVVDEAPSAIKEAVSKEEAEKIAEKMAEVGAKVTIK